MAENMTENANYIYSFFRQKGWTSNSICAMLGNMQGESGIIADMDELSGGGGYGLVQWTPKSNLTNWANQNGLNYRTVDTQCRRLQWELENGEQFYATSAYPMNFREFTQSTSSPTYLAAVFINNYERPYDANQPQRGVWAEQWYSILVGGTTPPTNSENEVQRYNSSGTCYPQMTLNIRTAPNAQSSSNIVDQYFKGESVIYDIVVYTNKYVYISWISASSGARRYMAIKDLATGEIFATTSSNIPTPPTNTENEVKRYAESGTCYPKMTLNIRTVPNAQDSSNIVGQYFNGESVIYDLVVQTNKYVYISWTSASSGARRYMAVRDLITGEKFADIV